VSSGGGISPCTVNFTTSLLHPSFAGTMRAFSAMEGRRKMPEKNTPRWLVVLYCTVRVERGVPRERSPLTAVAIGIDK